MNQTTSITHPAPASDAPSNPNDVALALNNNSTLNPTPVALPPSAGPAESPEDQRPDPVFLHGIKFLERMQEKFDPLTYCRGRLPDAPPASQSRGTRRRISLRHSRKCKVCNHAYREDIESDYLCWHDPANIATHYHLRSDSSIYRHARAVGLDEKRRHNLRGALEVILEQSHSASITSSGVVAAVRAHAALDDRYGWIEPTRHVVVTHVNAFSPVQKAKSLSAPRRRRFAPRPSRRPGKRSPRGISAQSKRGARRISARKTSISNRHHGSQSK